MLHIIKPDSLETGSLTLQDLLAHRINYMTSEGFENASQREGQDSFDTDQTTYLAFTDRFHDLVGCARALPTMLLPDAIKKTLPVNQKMPFVLVDCLFHIRESSELFKLPRPVMDRQFANLLDQFYKAITVYLENQALQHQVPMIPFYLTEEEFDLMQIHSGREIVLLKEFPNTPEYESHYVGLVDCSDLLGSTGIQEPRQYFGKGYPVPTQDY